MADDVSGRGVADAASVSPLRRRAFHAVFLLLGGWVLFSLLFALENFPGMNGDEAFCVLVWDLWRGDEIPELMLPSGRYPHYLLTALMLLSRAVFGSTAFALRIPIVLFGVFGLLVIAYQSRRLDHRDAPWIFGLTFSVHPMFLGYMRFAWEPSTFWTSAALVWFSVLWKLYSRPPALFGVWIAIGAVLTLLAHPINLLFLTSMALAVVWHVARKYEEATESNRLCSVRASVAAAGALLILAAMMVYYGATEIVRLAVWYAIRLSELLSGVRIFQYITGTPWGAWHAVQLVSSVGCFVAACTVLRRKNPRLLSFGLVTMVGGILVSFATQHLYRIEIGYGRYAMFLIFPFSFLLAAGFCALPAGWGRGLTVAYAVISLTSFTDAYFLQGFATANRAAHQAFWSGSSPSDPEPRRKAATWIEANATPDTRVYAGDYWTEKPLRYMLGRPVHPFVRVDGRPWRAAEWQGNWIVADFVRSPRIRRFKRFLSRAGIDAQTVLIRTEAGTPQMVLLHHLHPPASARRRPASLSALFGPSLPRRPGCLLPPSTASSSPLFPIASSGPDFGAGGSVDPTFRLPGPTRRRDPS